jgi:hypothetical protein
MQHVLELRREGKTYQQIADVVGLSSPHRAQTLVSRAIKRVLRETAEEVRSIELSRLEILIKCLWETTIKDLTQPDASGIDFRRFDRLKQLLEAKLKWCGAQAVIEDNRDQRVTIIVNSFTDKKPTEIVNPAPAPKQELLEELQMLAPEEPAEAPY